MNNIQFKSIRYKNFMSVGENEIKVDLNRTNSTLICGKNGNGKSILLEALSFVLFGKSYRGINKPSLVNSINQRGCFVEVLFTVSEDSYRIVRGLAPAKFEIWKNGEMLNKEHSVREQQSYLEENILGTTFPLFSQLVVVGAAAYTPFMKLSAADRRKMVETLLNIGVFSDMNKVLKGKISSWKDQVRDNQSSIETTEYKIEYTEGLIKKAQAGNESLISTKKADLERLVKEAKTLASEYKEHQENFSSDLLQDYMMQKAEKESERESLIKLLSSLETEQKLLKKDIDFFTKNDVCPTCKSDIDPSYKEEKLEFTKVSYKNKIAEADEVAAKKGTTERAIQDFKKKTDDMRGIKNTLETMLSDIEYVKSKFKTAKKDLETLEMTGTKDTTDEERSLVLLRAKLNVLKDEKTKLAAQKGVFDKCTRLLKDDGIKASIIRKYIPILNQSVNEYLKILNFPVRFELDENFNESLASRYTNEFKYESFSMGERQRLDLAIMFAWIEVAKRKSSMNTNLLILDEIDANMDRNGVDDLIEIVEQACQDKNVFIISHKEDIQDRVRSVIRFVKDNGFTKISS